MTVMMGAAMRYCPACATLTVEAFCPADGVATFARKKVLPTAAIMSVGDVVAGKFRVQRILGVGGFGAVYEAEHTGGLGRVALKMLSPADQDEGDIRRFFREAQVTAALRHPNTVRVFDVGQHDTGALYLAMELVHGHSLEDELRARKMFGEVMSEDETLEIGIDALRSLSEAHGRGLVHRDLKPANLMLTEVDGERVLKVLDFGIALVQGSSLTGSGRALGTPAYMSPEQCSGAEVDGRSDLYALGVVLYRCLAGQPPFQDANPLTVMMSHVSSPPPPLAQLLPQPVSQGLIDIIETALAKAPAERFADARTMRAALEAVQRARPQPLGDAGHKGGWNFRFRAEPDDGEIERTQAGAVMLTQIGVAPVFAAAAPADTAAASPVSASPSDEATRPALRREAPTAAPPSGPGDFTRFVERGAVASETTAQSTIATPETARRRWPWLAAGAVAVVGFGVWYAAAPVPSTATHVKRVAKAKIVPVISTRSGSVAVSATDATEVAAPLAPTPSEQARSGAAVAPVNSAQTPAAATAEPAGLPAKHPAQRHGHGHRGGARGDDDLSLPE